MRNNKTYVILMERLFFQDQLAWEHLRFLHTNPTTHSPNTASLIWGDAARPVPLLVTCIPDFFLSSGHQRRKCKHPWIIGATGRWSDYRHHYCRRVIFTGIFLFLELCICSSYPHRQRGEANNEEVSQMRYKSRWKQDEIGSCRGRTLNPNKPPRMNLYSGCPALTYWLEVTSLQTQQTCFT